MFLYGMSMLASGLERASGGRLERTLEKMTDTVIKGVALGALVTAGIHTAAAYPMVSKLLALFQLTSTGHYALCTAGTFAVFCAVYALVYGLTARAYRRIVA